LDGLSRHGGEATGIRDGELLCVFLRGSDQQVAGGAYGWTWGSACYVRYLFLPKEMRGLGLGTRFMGEVEREARARRCTQIAMETHDFQAPDFCRGLGFVVTGRVEDYPHGHSYLTNGQVSRWRVAGFATADTRDRDPATRPHLISHYSSRRVY